KPRVAAGWIETVDLPDDALLDKRSFALQLSRTVAWQTLTFAVMLLYTAGMLLATSAIASISGDNARLWQTAFVFGSTAAGLTIIS
ncbi:hypothetical protein ABTE27_22265, partial [Acinetobacter baumannii]